MTTTIGLEASNPYTTPNAGSVVDGVLEVELVTSLATAADPVVSGTTNLHAETYNGTIPGPTFHLTVGDTVIVRLVNNLDYPTGIHWHGIELQNSADGTPVTQNGAAAGPFPRPDPLILASPTGGTYLYKFTVSRPGIFWYHPHHHHSTNRVFKGLYGMIIVTDPDEEMLVRTVAEPTRPLPAAADTVQLVLSDVTVCGNPGSNPTYADPSMQLLADRAEWLSGANAQMGPSPESLCELEPLNDDGTTPGAPILAAGDIPHIQRKVPMAGTPPTVEGQTVLTNGVNVGARLGTPDSPKITPEAGAYTYDVQRGQGLRLQIVNCATTRYFRLRLTTTTADGMTTTQVPLVRVGGEGGLLDYAILEGKDSAAPGSFDPNYFAGEILVPAASRVDIVAAIPIDATGVMTLWTRDFKRTGGVTGNWSQHPSVPVMHLNVLAAPALVPAYNIVGAVDGVDGPGVTQLRASIGGAVVDPIDPSTSNLLDPTDAAIFTGGVKAGTSDPIQLLAGGSVLGINGTGGVKVTGSFGDGLFTPYTNEPHIDSSRYVAQGGIAAGNILELTVNNATGAHHPFHLHGFSFQPISLTRPGSPTFDWPYPEFRDNVDIPSQYTLTFRVQLTDRMLADNSTPGGAYGRWLFHCHIFFHAHQGMISEMVVTTGDGSEKPYVDVGGSWTYTAAGMTAIRHGTFFHRDLKTVSLTATRENGTTIGNLSYPPGVSLGNWLWEYPSVAGEEFIEYVYITATDDSIPARQDQTVFRLQVGGTDEGSDSGDPHIRTVNNIRYDFQAAGEFTLLRDREGMEIQTRQTPVQTANPITDAYSGLTSSVSLNTAVAARVGSHRISYQPGQEPGQLQFYLDGKPAQLSVEGIDLESHRVSAFDADGNTGLRVDYAQQAILTVTPRFWTSHNLWYMNISVSHTQGTEGLMGPISNQSWLPDLPSGATVGPKPKKLHDRYIALYQIFANAWRVTDAASLFVYSRGTSTKTFTDKDWPSETPPSILKPSFEIPGAPPPVSMPVADAELICQAVTLDDLHANCVFDVATTGDATFAEGYLLAQNLRLHSSAVQIVGDRQTTRPGESLTVTATVLATTGGRPTPTGKVTFLVDGVATGAPAMLDDKGRASHRLDHLENGTHKIRAVYSSNDNGNERYHASSSPNLLHTVNGDPANTGKWHFENWWIFLILIALIIILISWYIT